MTLCKDELDSEVQVLLASEEKDEGWESDEASESDELNACVVKDLILSEHETTRASLRSQKVVLRVYKRRWFILGIFSLLSFMQVCFHIIASMLL